MYFSNILSTTVSNIDNKLNIFFRGLLSLCLSVSLTAVDHTKTDCKRLFGADIICQRAGTHLYLPQDEAEKGGG